MSVRYTLLLLWAFVAPTLALAQGFAGLGTDAEGFAVPQRNTELVFPQDHGPHPDYRIEWWYLTANLQDADGQRYGVQWTLFRSALQPGEAESWRSPQLWMGHAGLTTSDTHFHAERLARGGIGQAGVTASPFEAWIDDWSMAGEMNQGLDALSLTASGSEFAYDLTLSANGTLVAHGDNGYSVKSPKGQASYYYSQPHYEVSGQITLPDGVIEVTGRGWLDREWSSQPLASDQTGWDWFSLRLEGGEKLMGFRLRDTGDGFTSGTWIDATGVATPLEPNTLQVSPLETNRVAGRDVPTLWSLTLPDREVNLTIQALNPNAWMDTSFPYWEGPVQFSGSHNGEGYLEMTGYD